MIRAIHFSDAAAFKTVGATGAIHCNQANSSTAGAWFFVHCPCGCKHTQRFWVNTANWNSNLQTPTLKAPLTFECGNRFKLELGYWEFV